MTTETAAAKTTDRIAAEIVLTVTHRVTVKIDGDSGQTMDQLKAAALKEFHRGHDAARGYVAGRRNDDDWRAQFWNRSNIEVGGEQVELTSVTTAPRR